MNMNKTICIVTYQFSVVVKGIEKELQKEGYEVALIGDDLDEIRSYTSSADLFLLYLADDFIDHRDHLKNILKVCDTITENGKRIIIIGTEALKDKILFEIPQMIDYLWVYRPVEMQDLKRKIFNEQKILTDIGRKKKILIVDDDPLYAKMVQEWLSEEYTVDVVNDGMQTISYLLSNPVDLVLLDYEMPVVDGAQVLGMLRSHKDTAKIPVVFLTGVKTKSSVERVVNMHPEGYILKSVTKDELLTTVEQFTM